MRLILVRGVIVKVLGVVVGIPIVHVLSACSVSSPIGSSSKVVLWNSMDGIARSVQLGYQ